MNEFNTDKKSSFSIKMGSVEKLNHTGRVDEVAYRGKIETRHERGEIKLLVAEHQQIDPQTGDAMGRESKGGRSPDYTIIYDGFTIGKAWDATSKQTETPYLNCIIHYPDGERKGPLYLKGFPNDSGRFDLTWFAE